MSTKEQCGGKMDETVEKIVINAENIEVITRAEGGSGISLLSLEAQEERTQEIFDRYNLNSVMNYPYDINILRALYNNEEQLREYLDACRKANASKKRIELGEVIPDIEYDLVGLKNSELDTSRQLEMYRKAKETCRMLGSKKVKLKMSVIDRAYYTVQKLLQSKNQKALQAIGTLTGINSDKKKTFIQQDPVLRESTDKVSEKFRKAQATTTAQEKSQGITTNQHNERD